MSETKKLTATITIEYEIDGKDPGEKKIREAINSNIHLPQYIGSEVIDGTDEWGIDIMHLNVEFND
jgi:hypothetical protein